MSDFEIRAAISHGSLRNKCKLAGLCNIYSKALFLRSPLCKQAKIMDQNFKRV